VEQLSHILTDMAGDYNTGPPVSMFSDVLPPSFSHSCGFEEYTGTRLVNDSDEAQLRSELNADTDTYNINYLSSHSQYLDFTFQ
jgi:hypothetical protein